MSVATEALFILAAATGAGAGVAALAKLPAGGGLDDRACVRVKLDPRPTQFVRLERILEWSGESGLSAHTRLRPVLIEIAEARLVRRGIRLDRDVEEARRLLGPAVWDLVRPDRPAPRRRDTPGIPPGRLEDILDALEAV